MAPLSARSRVVLDRLFKAAVVAFSFASIAPLAFILVYVFRRGIPALNWQLLVTLPRPVGEMGGGISNALLGTGILIGLSAALAVPPSILAGIYLAEHRRGRLAYLARLSVEILQGLPSIVIGIIAYIWIVLPMGGFSALSGAAALGIMMIPVTVRATEETLRLIPPSLKEASLALGVPYHRTILKVVVPAGLSGIMTGILLSVARIAGETAPLLFTAFGSPFMNANVLKPMSSLPLLIFNYATSPYPEWHTLAWGASLILVVLVLGLNLSAKLVTKKWKVQF